MSTRTIENLAIDVLRASFGSLVVGAIFAVGFDPVAGATASALTILPCFFFYLAADRASARLGQPYRARTSTTGSLFEV